MVLPAFDNEIEADVDDSDERCNNQKENSGDDGFDGCVSTDFFDFLHGVIILFDKLIGKS